MLFVLLSSNCITAQSVFPKNVADYYVHINRAELLITDGRFSEAIAVYDSAFAKIKQPFALDFYNAMQCANLAKDYPKTKQFALSLVDLGCNSDFFFKRQTLKDFRASTAYFSFTNEYAAHRAKFMKRCDWKLRTKLEKIALRDQYWREQDSNYERIRATTYRLDDTLMVEVQQIFEKGYPTERQVGINMFNDTTINTVDLLYIPILHNYSDCDKTKKGIDFTDVLLNFTKQGVFPADGFAMLNASAGVYSYKDKERIASNIAMVFDKKIYFMNWGKNAALKQTIDAQRQKHGLSTIAEAEKKVIYQYHKREGYFLFFKTTGVVGSISGMPQEMVEKMFKPTGLQTASF